MSGLGARFPKNVLRELKRHRIDTRTSVSIVFQQKRARWMIAGEEGGGSLDRIGHYVGYVGVAPGGMAVSIPIQSLIPNRTHRRVIGHDIVRIELFRYEQSCNLTITRHYLVSPGEGRRPELCSDDLLRQMNGILMAESKQPMFFDRAGEPIDLPVELIPAIQAASRGVLTQRNKRAHLIGVPDVALPAIETVQPKPAEAPAEVIADAIPPTDVVAPVAIDSEKRARGRRSTAKEPAA